MRSVYSNDVMKGAKNKILNRMIDNPKDTCRVVTKLWKYILLHRGDFFMSNGIGYEMKGKSIGAGVYEITAIPKM